MPRLIWVFAGRTVTLLVLSCRGSTNEQISALLRFLRSMVALYIKVQVHDQIFFAKDCIPCNRLCRNCSYYWSIFRRCLSFNKGLPLQSHRNISTKTARRAKCGTETLLVGTQPNRISKSRKCSQSWNSRLRCENKRTFMSYRRKLVFAW